METNVGPREPQEGSFFRNYKPQSWDIITLPNHIIYLILATVVVFLALYAIVSHLMKDLIHDLAESKTIN
ncbi:hypothetical protein SKAU_G00050840 [Synaphobranchus kaupii]|uniref:Uncharacterized protein n=1 Tax=Synaphobranchus kaupii TaxID=118154 RepID=A0A9Q1J7K4_SYNKA|nr:hypothetical protein SKAU_G00050840 [Synaphobranchus kaupii]